MVLRKLSIGDGNMNIIGQFFDSSGYAIHTRNLANALSKYMEVSLITGLPNGWERSATDKELEMIKRTPKNDINLIITNPTHWRLHLNAKRNWVFLVWEGDKLPTHYLEECLNPKIEYVFVPSEHSKKALWNSYFSGEVEFNENLDGKDKEFWDKVKIMSHGVDLDKFYSKNKPNKTVFVCNKGFRNLEDRGGIQYAIKAYLEEFTNEDVELLIKINPAYGVPDLNKIIQLFNLTDKSPKIKINADLMDYNKLVDFYNQGNIFLAPTRAEAYNLGCIEAMACGLPVITTDFGGQTDYCNEENGWIISGELKEVENELMYEGIKWLTPDIQQLRKCMREAYENKELVKQKSENSIKTSQKNTWDHTAQLINSLI